LRRDLVLSLDGAHLIELVKQIEGQRDARQIQAEITLQALCLGDANDAKRRELPTRSRPRPTGSITPCSISPATQSGLTSHERHRSSSVHMALSSTISDTMLGDAFSPIIL
jgi:hypothetical protein